MKRIKLIIIILISFVLLFIMSSGCNYKYTGKSISSIEYLVVDYNGGYTKETKVDLINCQVLSRESLPINSSIKEYSLDYNFDIDSIDLFLNEAGKAGLFNLEDNYPSPGGIVDGGGWTLTINFSDDTSKVSTGDNNYPDNVFEKADYAFYDLYGDDLFGTLPNSYVNPPSIDIAINYSIDGNQYNQGYSGISAINYTWNKSCVDNVDVIEYAKQHQLHEFDPYYEYKLILWTANYEYKFSKMVITSFDLNGSDEKEISKSSWFKQKEYDLTLNRIYVIKMTFSYGTCEYAFSTITDYITE